MGGMSREISPSGVAAIRETSLERQLMDHRDESGTNLSIAKFVCKEKTDFPRALKIQSDKRAVPVIKKGRRNWPWEKWC